MNITRAYTELTVKSVDEDRRIIKGWATTPQVDRVGDIVDPMGATFSPRAPLLWQHKHDQPVGFVNFGRPEAKGIPFEAEVAKMEDSGNLKDRLDEAWQSVKSGLVRFVSVGMKPKPGGLEPLPSGGVRFKSYELIELSLVTIPANPGATITEIKAYDKGLLTAASGENERTESDATPRRVEAKTPPVVILAQAKGKNEMKLSESLKGYQDALAAKKADRMTAVQKSLDEGRTADAAEIETIQTLNGEIKALEDQIAMVKGLVDADVTTAKAVSGTTEQNGMESRGATPVITVQANRAEKGLAMAQLVRLKYQSGGNPFYAAQIAESQKGALDPRVVEIAKAAVPAAQTGNPTWAGNLVTQGGLIGDFVEFLRPQTLLGRIPGLRLVPFNIPLIGQTSGGAGYWVGEGQAKPLTQWAYGTNILQPLKVANIAVITEELLKRASVAADTMIRDQLVAALRERLDIDFVDPAKAAVAGVSPASITNGVTGIPSSGNDAAAIRADVAALMGGFLAANNVPSTGVYIMRSETALMLSMMQNPLGQTEFPGIGMTGGMFMGLPALVSDYAPAGTVILMNASDIYFADEGGFEVDMSREASLQMDNAPTQNSTTPTPATGMVSMFQTNSVAFRAERILNWGKRRPGAVQMLTGVAWGQPTP